jgi:hypothetical protein
VVPTLRAHCAGLGIRLLQRESTGARPPPTAGAVRFVGVVRWSDFDLFGAAARTRDAGRGYFMR